MRYNPRLAEYVNTSLSFRDEWERLFGSEMGHGNVFCPFHTNTDTPAAKGYGNGLKCFSCQRFYSVFDLLNKFDESRLKQISSEVLLPAGMVAASRNVLRFAPRESLNLESELYGLLYYITNYGKVL